MTDHLFAVPDDEDPDYVAAADDPFLGDVRVWDDLDADPAAQAHYDREHRQAAEAAGLDGIRYTDSGNAERLIRDHGDEIRYVPAWGRWLVFDGRRWILDADDVRVQELAKDVPRRLLALVADAPHDKRKALVGWASKSEMASGLGATIKTARSLPGMAVDADDLDADRWLLNVANGVLDLHAGELHQHSPDRLITRLAPVEYRPDADAPTFAAFLERIFPDPEVRAYVRRFVGYCLTGSVDEQVLNLWWGIGRNGKSTLLGILEALFGTGHAGYSTTVGRDLLVVQKHESHDTKFVDLFRARVASCSELRDGAALDEARVKALTGGDRIRARRMREDYWTFEPTHKLIVATNHRPTISADDFAVWRRIHLVPFTTTIPAEEVDPQLAARIIATELPGVLAWAVRGCLEWQQVGLNPPEAVQAATDGYRAESDTVAAFIADAGIGFDLAHEVDSSELQELHNAWCDESGVNPRAHWHEVAKYLKAHGAENRRRAGGTGRYWRGVTLIAPPGCDAL